MITITAETINRVDSVFIGENVRTFFYYYITIVNNVLSFIGNNPALSGIFLFALLVLFIVYIDYRGSLPTYPVIIKRK